MQNVSENALDQRARRTASGASGHQFIKVLHKSEFHAPVARYQSEFKFLPQRLSKKVRTATYVLLRFSKISQKRQRTLRNALTCLFVPHVQ